MNDITFIEPFAGIGGFRLGLESVKSKEFQRKKLHSRRYSNRAESAQRKQSDFTCVWSNEWDKYCAKIYEKNFGEAPDTRDIRTIPSKEIPDHDLLCAGWPCQSFSVAGNRGGFEDTRGTLFFEICRIARDKRTSYLLLENVKGLLSHQNGWTFATILLSLDELGYDVEWQVLNSKNFGVPQNRERVFIVGHLRGKPWKQVFPLEKSIQAANAKGNVRNISGTISTKNQSGQAQWDASTTLVATCLDANYHRGRDNHGQRTMLAITDSGKRRQKEIRKDILPPLRAGHKDAVQIMVIRRRREAGDFEIQKLPGVTKHYGTGGGNVPLIIGNIYPSKGQAGQVLDSKGISKAIVPAKRGGSAAMPIVANTLDRDGYLRDGKRKRVNGKAVLTSIPERRIRRLTPVECERLQGFPDAWSEGVSDTQRYKALGNAVTVNVIEAIGRQLMKSIGRKT